MNPLKNSTDNKLNTLIGLVNCLIILQIINCIFSYKIKENSYITANAALHNFNAGDKPAR